ncbi:hypothetical protein SAMN00017477_1895 [Peptoniphilus asaccharolyticus DSM 20463]|uniref:Uncharacterized protein n=1 Tax=Peptoniphilus asaccharolyticus DSM 20463 TaxID=573058 RepID=A0A1W1VGL9_PEPAS|nr:hypothetical protein SAMN00017477_1895 [Peptoniphilus asaccharolyticus DSM 20463]
MLICVKAIVEYEKQQALDSLTHILNKIILFTYMRGTGGANDRGKKFNQRV